MLRRLVSALAPITLGLCATACVAVPIRDPSTLSHYEAAVQTDDGWELALFRLPPAPEAAGTAHFGTPLLLAHGTAINRFNFMLTGRDLARFLSDRGFDVWLPELRGDRSSRAPDKRTWRRGEWTLDDMANEDIPMVLKHIKQASGRDQVWWLGHSLGGILGYVTLQGPSAKDVAGIIAIGSPGDFRDPSRLLRRGERAGDLLPKHGQVPARGLAKFAAPLIHLAPDSNLLHAILNYDNVDLESMVGFVNPGMENIAVSLLRQYRSWLVSGSLTSADGTVDYSDGLAKVQVPALFIAGRVDHIVPPWVVRSAYERIGSRDKSFVVLGRGWGTRHDYGHGDLLVGSRVREEVFPLISAWLEDRIAGLDAPAGALELLVDERVDPLLEASELDDANSESVPPDGQEAVPTASPEDQ
jgi:pimeloyl-ACP methyl ester carboxylesterase